MTRLLECVPNFSEGNDLSVIKQITDAIEAVDGVSLLDVDPGKATNRTVVTFAGEPDAVIEAAVQAGRKAAELIDMSRHQGEHPRFGAMDVCPLVPIAGMTMDETVECARELARRLAEEAGLTVYCYEHAATSPDRRNLAVVRAGEYEALPERLAKIEWKPDFGPAEFNARSGATAVSARDFLVAYNVNLNTTSARRANAIAFDVREKGRMKREGNPLTGEVVRDDKGKPVWIPGALKAVKGIGWYIEEYGICQVSLNLTNISVTSVHEAFEEVKRSAESRGVRVTGSELIGLIPLQAMLDAGRYYLRMQKRSTGIANREIVKIAAKSLGLDDLSPFDPDANIIEYVLARKAGTRRLVDRTVREFVEETASESPAPGGGSVSANVGALGAALAAMVANLSSHKRGWDDRWEEFSDHAEAAKACHDELLTLIDRDTDAFNGIMAAWRLPDGSDEEKSAKHQAVQSAVLQAMQVPYRIMEVARDSMSVARAMAESGLQASVSDAGVAALCARTAVMGAYLNVQINSADLEDDAAKNDLLKRGAAIQEEAQKIEDEILAIVRDKISA